MKQAATDLAYPTNDVQDAWLQVGLWQVGGGGVLEYRGGGVHACWGMLEVG